MIRNARLSQGVGLHYLLDDGLDAPAAMDHGEHGQETGCREGNLSLRLVSRETDRGR